MLYTLFIIILNKYIYCCIPRRSITHSLRFPERHFYYHLTVGDIPAAQRALGAGSVILPRQIQPLCVFLGLHHLHVLTPNCRWFFLPAQRSTQGRRCSSVILNRVCKFETRSRETLVNGEIYYRSLNIIV
jgi:hypothetical protein